MTQDMNQTNVSWPKHVWHFQPGQNSHRAKAIPDSWPGKSRLILEVPTLNYLSSFNLLIRRTRKFQKREKLLLPLPFCSSGSLCRLDGAVHTVRAEPFTGSTDSTSELFLRLCLGTAGSEALPVVRPSLCPQNKKRTTTLPILHQEDD